MKGLTVTTKLKSVRLVNFKSLRDQTIDLQSVNVLIGANGSGKSNLLSFFKLLHEMIGGRLQEYIEVSGGANSVLYYGSQISPFLEAELKFDTWTGESKYYMRLVFAVVDRLIFSEERIEFQKAGSTKPFSHVLGGGHRETELLGPAAAKGLTAKAKTANIIKKLLSTCRVYQFHDTSITSRMRQPNYVDNNRFLMPDGGNLASFLYRLQRDDPTCYSRIRKTIQQVAPFFDDFVLDPAILGGERLRLNWSERDSDQFFGPHQISDGTLRAMALITLLLQPTELLPTLVVIDEPELGLHPAAAGIIAALIKQAASTCQVLVATQSTTLLDAFEPSQVVVVERDEKSRQSIFQRLEPSVYTEWLDRYSLHELWERNVIGGGPY